jgi:hypothetical protein
MDRPWSAEQVELRLTQAFKEMQGRPIYSCKMNSLRELGGKRISGLDLIACTADILGRDSELRIILLTWARAKAGGPSFAEMVRAHPSWGCEKHAHRKRERASQLVSEAIIKEQRALLLSC